MERKKEKSAANKMGTAPYHDATPPRMSRSVGKGPSGNTWSIPNGAKYGLGEGKQPTRMDRSGGKGKSGSGFSLEAKGPATSSRKDTGANTNAAKSYGVGGVAIKDGSGRYGI
jgi:hypothetical protein